eukprot:15366641-Ditylum_brightwellii.AAC.1
MDCRRMYIDWFFVCASTGTYVDWLFDGDGPCWSMPLCDKKQGSAAHECPSEDGVTHQQCTTQGGHCQRGSAVGQWITV